MLIGRIKNRIYNRRKFYQICKANSLLLNYSDNRKEIPVLAEIFEKREYADFFPFYKKACIIDIGAHYGYFSLFASRNSDPKSRILAFEPFPSNLDMLKQNSSDCKISNIESQNCAISDISGSTKLFSGQSVNNSILKDFSMIHGDNSSIKIESKTLEQIIKENSLDKIDFLKMDCEGSEYAIFESTSKSVFDKITTISMEFHDMRSAKFNGEFLIEKLIEYGFEIVKYQYSKTTMGINYGKIIGTKILKEISSY